VAVPARPLYAAVSLWVVIVFVARIKLLIRLIKLGRGSSSFCFIVLESTIGYEIFGNIWKFQLCRLGLDRFVSAACFIWENSAPNISVGGL